MKLPIIRNWRAARQTGDSVADDPVRRFTLTAELPALGRKPLWRLRVEMTAEPQGSGERVHMRAHMEANFADALALAAARPVASEPGTRAGRMRRRTAESVVRIVQKVVDRPVVQRVGRALLLHNFNSWIDVRASTADLAFGARALIPETERLKGLGIEPQFGDGPLAQTWAGGDAAAGAEFAQVSLLQFEKRHLPAQFAALFGGNPFHFAGALVNVIEDPAKR